MLIGFVLSGCEVGGCGLGWGVGNDEGICGTG